MAGDPGPAGSRYPGSVVESVFESLEPLLPRVKKPVQYVGGERNAGTKPWDAVPVHWALCYPDAYEVGLPNQGLMILYEVLNERDDALAERTYAVWPDLAALMREHGVPQFTVDGHRPVGAFDVLGISFATELGYTNMLSILDLAGIPLHAADRDTSHPIVLAGGHAAFNPEPIADFVDIVALGDGEEVVGEITDVVKAAKAEGLVPRARPSSASPGSRASTCPASTTSATATTGRSPRSPRPARTPPSASTSAPPATSTTGRTRRPRSSRWPRPSTSG